MRRDDVLRPAILFDIGEALVMNDDIEPLGPVLLFIERDLATGGTAPFVDDHHVHVSALHHALGKEFLLRVVVMATPATDEQHLERLGGIGGQSQAGTEGESPQCDDEQNT